MQTPYATMIEQPETLHSRTLRARFPERTSTLLFLKQGALSENGRPGQTIGPAICYWPPIQRPQVQLLAGARARLLGLSDGLILDAIGARAESVHLRMLVENTFNVALSRQDDFLQVDALINWFSDELSTAPSPSHMTLAAFLRLIFIRALRLHRPEHLEREVEQTGFLRRFRHLVELNYTQHWKVSHYADELGVSYDRLHHICKRGTGRSPVQLVHERLTTEAKARLESSGYPLKKIATDLGFVDPTRFSHFFKRQTEMSPGAYRTLVSQPEGEDLTAVKQGFSDWP